MLKKVRELLVAGLLSLTLGVGLAAVVIVAMLAVWYTLGAGAAVLGMMLLAVGVIVYGWRSER